MKKILLLGGSAQQVVAIEKAKELGYYTVLCDYLVDNPGQYKADRFFLESTTNKERILEIAIKENINGILAYASDPASATAAYVAEHLGLPTNSYEIVDIFSNKNKFRKFLQENDFAIPKNITVIDNWQGNMELSLPIIVKPVDSSGSKGITKIDNMDQLPQAIVYAMQNSRSHKIEVEEFIEKDHSYIIGGDLIVENGKIILYGLMNCHRSDKVNPLVPIGKSYPLKQVNRRIEILHKELQRLIDCAKIKFGAFNIEIIFDKDDRMYILDIGARAGGNMIPELLSIIYNFDLIKMLIQMAMGQRVIEKFETDKKYYCSYNINSCKNGILKYIKISNKLNIILEKILVKEGNEVSYFDFSSKLLGIIFLKFDSMEHMLDMMDNAEKWIEVGVD